MNPNIEVIYLHFQGNKTDVEKLSKCFPTYIQNQQSRHLLNYKKHMLQLHVSKEFKVPEILHNHTTIHSIK